MYSYEENPNRIVIPMPGGKEQIIETVTVEPGVDRDEFLNQCRDLSMERDCGIRVKFSSEDGSYSRHIELTPQYELQQRIEELVRHREYLARIQTEIYGQGR